MNAKKLKKERLEVLSTKSSKNGANFLSEAQVGDLKKELLSDKTSTYRKMSYVLSSSKLIRQEMKAILKYKYRKDMELKQLNDKSDLLTKEKTEAEMLLQQHQDYIDKRNKVRLQIEMTKKRIVQLRIQISSGNTEMKLEQDSEIKLDEAS
ncbi:hypothetical protein HDE_09051 [Halotydeus destructor]|nr:hypothetical protein HDE_09051 [Halotydeus destructor]